MPPSTFHYRRGQLTCEQTPLQDVAARFGTPCYVYSRQAIEDNLNRFRDTFRCVDPMVCYAVKANSNLAILRLLKERGCGFDVVSGGELHRLSSIGADPDRILFSGVGKAPAELEAALELSLHSINVESPAELDQLDEISRRVGASPSVALRINPEVDAATHPYVATGFRHHKFGIDAGQLAGAVDRIADSALRLRGLAFHIGSQILDIQSFLDAFRKLKSLADDLRSAGRNIEWLDLGGGFGIPYRGEDEIDLSRYAALLERERGPYRIIFEPGRIIVGTAGVLLTRVLYRKHNCGHEFLVVDAGMNDLIRPSLYGAWHEIRSLHQVQGRVLADVVGPVCETGDFLARDREVPDLGPGQYLAIMDCGAYGFVAASNYNSRPRPVEVMVEGDRAVAIRRRETPRDLIRGELP